MAERVMVVSVRPPHRTIKLDPRLAAHLVARGTHAYLTEAVEIEGDAVQPRARKRNYRRRDMQAES